MVAQTNFLSLGSYRTSKMFFLKDRIHNLCNRFGRRKQHPTTKHRPPQPHNSAAPKAANAIILDNTRNSLRRSRNLSSLRPRLDNIKRLRTQRSNNSRRRPIHKIRHRILRNLSQLLEILDDIVRTHAKTRRRSLLHSRAREPTVQTNQTVLFQNHANAMHRRSIALHTPRIINQRRLDPLRRRNGKYTSQHPRAHARQHIPRRRQRARDGILEGVLDRVERQETHRVLGDAADHENAAAFVHGAHALGFVYIDHDAEGVAGRFHSLLVLELHARLCEFEGICAVQED